MTQYTPLLHTHAWFREEITDDEVIDALPAEPAPTRALLLHDPTRRPVGGLARLDWRAAQLHLAAGAEKLREKLHGAGGRRRVAYFGATFIPLALDLGYRSQGWLPIDVFQHHHQGRHWRWPGRAAGVPEPETEVRGLPETRLDGEGDVVLRVCTSYAISPDDTAAVVADPLASIDLTLRRLSLDAFASAAELDAFVSVFADLVGEIHARLPNRRALHLFVAGPVGLCLRLGAALNPSIFPRVVAWQYEQSSRPRYQRAFRLGLSPAQLQARLGVLFLASEPGPRQLRLDIEHRDIQKRLRLSTLADRFSLSTHQAVEARDLSDLLLRQEGEVLHWSGHASPAGEIRVAAAAAKVTSGGGRDLPLDAVVELLRHRASRLPLRLVVLNLCHSAVIARALTEAGIADCAVGMTDSIADEGAILFSEGLYGALGEGCSVGEAFARAKNHMSLTGTHNKDERVVELFAAPGVNPLTLDLLDPG